MSPVASMPEPSQADVHDDHVRQSLGGHGHASHAELASAHTGTSLMAQLGPVLAQGAQLQRQPGHRGEADRLAAQQGATAGVGHGQGTEGAANPASSRRS